MGAVPKQMWWVQFLNKGWLVLEGRFLFEEIRYNVRMCMPDLKKYPPLLALFVNTGSTTIAYKIERMWNTFCWSAHMQRNHSQNLAWVTLCKRTFLCGAASLCPFSRDLRMPFLTPLCSRQLCSPLQSWVQTHRPHSAENPHVKLKYLHIKCEC